MIFDVVTTVLKEGILITEIILIAMNVVERLNRKR